MTPKRRITRRRLSTAWHPARGVLWPITLLFVGLVTGLLLADATASAPAPIPDLGRIVQSGDGTYHYVRSGVRHALAPAAITDSELAALTEDTQLVGGQLPLPSTSA